jgi:hypothetical protein
VAELPPVSSLRDVGDNVELLAGVEKRLFEREIVARGHDQLVGNATGAKQRRKGRKKAVHCGRAGVSLQHRVKLVVKRPRALHDCDVLRDAWKLGGIMRILEAF